MEEARKEAPYSQGHRKGGQKGQFSSGAQGLRDFKTEDF